MSPSLYRPVDDWLDGSPNFTPIIAVSALIAVIIAGVLAGLAIMTVRRTNRTGRPNPGPAPSAEPMRAPGPDHQGSPGASPENTEDG